MCSFSRYIRSLATPVAVGATIFTPSRKLKCAASDDSSQSGSTSLCRFGVITDVQYCEIDPAVGWDKYVRNFRGSLAQLQQAVTWWHKDTKLDFILQGGDLIDARCAQAGIVEDCLERSLTKLEKVGIPLLHMVGNHEITCMPLADWCHKLGVRGAPKHIQQRLEEGLAYGSWQIKGVRILILNGFQESLLHNQGGSADTTAATYFEDCKRKQGYPQGKTHLMSSCNGGLGAKQLIWLDKELQEASCLCERVVVCCHQPLHPAASEGISMPWDYKEALEILGRHPGVPIAVIAGHYHFGGYHCDADGVHHLTLQSPLLRGASGFAYGSIEIFTDKLVLRGPRLVDLLSGDSFTGSWSAGWNDPPVAKGYIDKSLACDVWESLTR